MSDPSREKALEAELQLERSARQQAERARDSAHNRLLAVKAQLDDTRAAFIAADRSLQGMRSALEMSRAELTECSQQHSEAVYDRIDAALTASSGPSPTTTTDELARAYQEGREAGKALVREAKAEDEG